MPAAGPQDSLCCTRPALSLGGPRSPGTTGAGRRLETCRLPTAGGEAPGDRVRARPVAAGLARVRSHGGGGREQRRPVPTAPGAGGPARHDKGRSVEPGLCLLVPRERPAAGPSRPRAEWDGGQGPAEQPLPHPRWPRTPAWTPRFPTGTQPESYPLAAEAPRAGSGGGGAPSHTRDGCINASTRCSEPPGRVTPQVAWGSRVQNLHPPPTLPPRAPRTGRLRPPRQPSPRGHLLLSERKCCRMRAREPLLARSARAPGQLGIRSAWYRAPRGDHGPVGHGGRGHRPGPGPPRAAQLLCSCRPDALLGHFPTALRLRKPPHSS